MAGRAKHVIRSYFCRHWLPSSLAQFLFPVPEWLPSSVAQFHLLPRCLLQEQPFVHERSNVVFFCSTFCCHRAADCANLAQSLTAGFSGILDCYLQRARWGSEMRKLTSSAASLAGLAASCCGMLVAFRWSLIRKAIQNMNSTCPIAGSGPEQCHLSKSNLDAGLLDRTTTTCAVSGAATWLAPDGHEANKDPFRPNRLEKLFWDSLG